MEGTKAKFAEEIKQREKSRKKATATIEKKNQVCVLACWCTRKM